MKIKLTSIFVNDQAKALKFYTNTLGFQKKQDIPMGLFRFLTVTSPDDSTGIELSLEPNNNPAATTYQRAIFEQCIPAAAFEVEDVYIEYERLEKLQVAFKQKPMSTETTTQAVFNDTCGNYILIYQELDSPLS